MPWGSFIFGLDGDPPDAFERTVDFCIEAKVAIPIFSLLTPYPGTALYKRLKAEGRLTKDAWWLSSDHDKDAPFYRVRVNDRKLERLVNLADFGKLAQGRFGVWTGLGPDDSLLASRDISVQEIYALDWQTH